MLKEQDFYFKQVLPKYFEDNEQILDEQAYKQKFLTITTFPN